MAPQDSGLSSLKNEELVVLTMEAIAAGPLQNEAGELIVPVTEQAKAADAVLESAVQELLRRAGGRPIAIHFHDGRVLCVRP
jgi:hypothetical protein